MPISGCRHPLHNRIHWLATAEKNRDQIALSIAIQPAAMRQHMRVERAQEKSWIELPVRAKSEIAESKKGHDDDRTPPNDVDYSERVTCSTRKHSMTSPGRMSS
jgi:hypothetical protein